jgi:quinoprotein glucose dehydrogenase
VRLKDAVPRAARAERPAALFENLIILGPPWAKDTIPRPGHLRAYDVRTGKLAWLFHTIPAAR